MHQFAKNYLKICLESKVNNFLQSKYEKCIKKNKEDFCNKENKKWLNI